MRSIGGFVFFMLALAFTVPRILSGHEDAETAQASLAGVEDADRGPATAKAFRDGRGHFSFSSHMNGKRVKALVDTGATTVAINERTAKRIGVRYGNRGTMRVSTANGSLTAHRAVIKEIRIGKVVVRNVKALVLDNQALGETLLGMSFLKKLDRFEISGRTLTLVQ